MLGASMRFLALLVACCLAVPAFAAGASVSIPSSDGVTVKAADYGKGSTDAIVLVHDKGRTNADWSYFAERLGAAGFHVVAIDLRGHGASKPPDALAEADWPKTKDDVVAAVAWLRAKGAKKVTLVGAGLGANLALVVGAEDPAIANLVLLSPGLNIAGIAVGDALTRYGERPVLLVGSSEDGYTLRTINVLEEQAQGTIHVEVLENAGSGVKMLNRDASLEGTLIAWLNGTFFLKSGQKSPTPQINTGDTSTMETTGTKFGEEKPAEDPKEKIDLDD
jgi:dienelactone hydrolase